MGSRHCGSKNMACLSPEQHFRNIYFENRIFKNPKPSYHFDNFELFYEFSKKLRRKFSKVVEKMAEISWGESVEKSNLIVNMF